MTEVVGPGSNETGAEFFTATAEIQMPAGVAGPDPMSFDVHAFVVKRGEQIMLVDTLLRPEHQGLLEGALRAAGVGFADIDFVILTHHHPDHTGGLAEVARLAPQAKVFAGAGDLDAIARTSGVNVEPLSGGEVIMGLEVIATPGHTPGHLCLFDPISSTMLLGDLAGNYGGLQRPPAVFTEDAAGLEDSIEDKGWQSTVAVLDAVLAIRDITR